MKFSTRVEKMSFSSIRKLTPFAEEARAKGIKVYPLNIGQPDIVTPDTFFEGIKRYEEKIVKYSESQGILSLRETFINNYKKWNIDLTVDDILITQGGSEAVVFALMSLCNEGDEVIVPEPFYSNYNSFATICGANIVPVLTKIENGFHLPPKEDFISKISDKTKCILISNPVNPTGTVYTKEELRMLADIAKEYDLFIISDEVYREFVFDDNNFVSLMHFEDIQNRVILIDSISKHYSACGARIGLIGTKNTELQQHILKLCQSRLCASTIEQYAASNLINTLDDYISEVKKQYMERRDLMYSCLSNIPGVVCSKPEGAIYIFAKLPIDDGDKFAEWLLRDFSYDNSTVMVAPGKGFYNTPDTGVQEIRFSYCINKDDIKKSMEILEVALREYNKR
ncbi:MAG: pyridoxal phosphate-dependent aminotransferase [Clostridiaceae bacterium]